MARHVTQQPHIGGGVLLQPNHQSSYQFGPPDNIDERDAEDPLCVTDYVQDMYEHFRSKEALTSVRPVYMETQTHRSLAQPKHVFTNVTNYYYY